MGNIIVEKNNVDQSSSRGDVKNNPCMVTCGYIMLVVKNIIIGIGYVYVTIQEI